MKEIIGFIRLYSREINKSILLACSLFMTGLIWLNYSRKLEYHLVRLPGLPVAGILGRCLIYLAAFLFAYSLVLFKRKNNPLSDYRFILCLFAAPVIFAVKAGLAIDIPIASDDAWNDYWNQILYWPVLLLLVVVMLALVYYSLCPDPSLYGLVPKRKFNARPYVLMLLIMMPLIAIASTQPDFLATYPKLKMVLPLPESAKPSWWYQLLFELSYGMDFLSIELFFRGFLVLGFMKWVGKDAILPMACFYCTIHFGKPLGECISSYFGGLLLGIVSYHTRSIYGGLMVHLGIAWLMEGESIVSRMFFH
jgi:hypothetical protein